MTKNRSKMLLIFLSLILIIGLVASFISFKYPLSIKGVYYKYSSFTSELVLGGDVDDGVLFEYDAKTRYEADEEKYDALRENTIEGLKDILESAGYKNSTVATQGDKGIRIEVGGINNKSDSDEVISLIGSPKQLRFATSENPTDDDIIMTGDGVKSVKAKVFSNAGMSAYYVEITFTDKGFEQIQKTYENNGSATVYMLLGDTTMGSSSEKITTKSISMTSERFVDMQTTEMYAVQMRTGLLPLELVCTYNGTVSANGGYNAMQSVWIVLGIMVVASMVLLAIRYKQIGLMACFNLLFYIVLGLFFLQSIPIMHINICGVFAIVIGYVLCVMGLVSSLENARQEYAKGKKLHTCLKQGINSSIISTLSINILLTLGAIICALMPNMAIQSFGRVGLVLGLLNMFICQVWMRVMINLYLPFNAYDGSKCNFTKEEGLNND